MESSVLNCILYSHLNSWRHMCSAAEFSLLAVVLYVTAVVRVLTARRPDAWLRCLEIARVFVSVLRLLLLNWYCVYLVPWRTLSIDIAQLSGRRYTIQTRDNTENCLQCGSCDGENNSDLNIQAVFAFFLLPCPVSNSFTLSRQAR